MRTELLRGSELVVLSNSVKYLVFLSFWTVHCVSNDSMSMHILGVVFYSLSVHDCAKVAVIPEEPH